jgi:hypothetical protein
MGKGRIAEDKPFCRQIAVKSPSNRRQIAVKSPSNRRQIAINSLNKN